MHPDPVIAAAAAEYADLTLGESHERAQADPYAHYCEYARSFAQWSVELVRTYGADDDMMRLAQAKVLLLDKYFEFRSYVPKVHKDRTAEKGHVCLYHVFVEAYRRIRMKEMTIAPPKIFVLEVKQEERSSAASSSLAHVPALYLGEVQT